MTADAFGKDLLAAGRRYLALWLPFLPTDRLRRQTTSAARDERPLVVVDKIDNALRLVAVDRRAAELGLAPGLSLADARARLPDIAVAEADAVAEAALIERMAAWCEMFTPLVALDAPHGLALDITGCAHLFGGEAELVRHIRRRLWGLGFAARAAIAGTPDAARACARFGAGGVISPGGEMAAARPLPVAALGLPQDVGLALARAGLKTLGDLAERPASVLAARFGAELVSRLARVLGRDDIRVTPLRRPPDCLAERHFPEPLAQAEAIEGVVAALARDVVELLERRGAGGRLFDVALFRSDGAVRRLAIETGHPCRDVATILRLFRLRLDSLADPLDPGFGFDAIRFAAPLAEPMADVQRGLDGEAHEETDLADLIDKLVVRLGRDRVLRFLARDSHHPLRAAAATPAIGSAPAAPWDKPEAGEPPARPLQLFEPPQPVEVMAEVPDGPPLRFRWRRLLHEIARAEGPERIAPEWWRDGPDEPTRDYYRVEDARGRRFWVFRQGLYERDEAGAPRWFVHGLFA